VFLNWFLIVFNWLHLVHLTFFQVTRGKKMASCDHKDSKYQGYAIGIDLGTTYSCVSVFRSAAVGPEVIANSVTGGRTMPSYVAFSDNGERLVGDGAKNQAAMNPTNTIFDAKRLIGRAFNDPTVQSDMKLWPFKVVDDGKNQPQIQVQVNNEVKHYYPQQISAMVLTSMKETAETFLGQKVRDAVITVPAYFNNQQKEATKDAAVIAGLNPLRLVSEPTAASMAYGFQKKQKKQQTVLVFDLGGGTFDVSLLEIDDDVYEVKAVAGDCHLGGEDFDARMVQYFAREFKQKHQKDITKSDRALRRLRTACERAKRQLSASVSATVEIDSLMDGQDFTSTITRARFEELNADYFLACLKPVEKVLTDAKVSKSEINEIVLVGGSTRIPKVQELVRNFFGGKELCNSVNVDEAVAVGAAIQAAIITKQVDTGNALVIDVTPLSLGIETAGGVMTKLIERNSQVPCRKSNVFSTYADNQTAVVIHIFEGERARTADNRVLGKFELTGIEPKPRGVPQIEVSFDLDCNGILKVAAEDKASKRKSHIEVKNDTGKLSKDQIDQMVKEAERFKDEDALAIKRTEAMQKLESLTYSLRDTLKNIEEKKMQDKIGDPITLAALEDKVKSVMQWIVSAGSNASVADIDQQFSQLENVAKPIMTKLYADGAPTAESATTPPLSTSSVGGVGGPKVEEVD